MSSSLLRTVVVGLSWLGLVASAAAAPATADGRDEINLEPDPAWQRCLKAPASAMPGFVPDAGGGRTGIARVRMRFTEPEQPPEVTVIFNSGGPAFEQFVRGHIAGFRYRCAVTASEPFVAAQEFRFNLDGKERTVWSEPRIEWGMEERLSACLVAPKPRIDYPKNLYGRNVQGVVLARYAFTSADAPPNVEILYDGGVAEFGELARRHGQRYRLPCLRAADGIVRSSQVFSFAIAGESRSVLRDATLSSFLRSVRDLGASPVRFDFTTMGCPFDVRFRLLQPALANEVGQRGAADPNRREFVEWLRTLDLALTPEQRRQTYAEEMTIAVPCAVVDLT